MMIKRENIVTICYSDIAGQLRGKGFPACELEGRRRFGIGWAPSNVMINCFGRIPATPFGTRGDLMIVPSAEGDIRLDYGDDGVVEHLILGDVQGLDGSPWSCCPRSFLRKAIAALAGEFGLQLRVSFEHEFWLDYPEEGSGRASTVGRLRGLEPFIGDVLGALRANDIVPDSFLPEFGPGQFEITVDPAAALAAADHAVKLREICRSVARRHGRRISFSPVVTPGIVGNGVHIHFSLLDEAGVAVGHDADRPGGLSDAFGAFAAGILHHAPALLAVTAPSVVSYERMKPGFWSPLHASIAEGDRGALLRICPVPRQPDLDVARLYNLEYRGADASASPYLKLGMLIFAGLEGLRRNLPAPPVAGGHRRNDRDLQGFSLLPRSLADSLQALETDEAARGWLGPEFSEVYLMHKRAELATAGDVELEELCRRYADVY